MNFLLSCIFIGSFIVTSYRSVPSQTDSSPYITSIGDRVHDYNVAVSQDLLKKNGGPLDYGDVVLIEGVGLKIVNDCMNAKFKRRMDVWVKSHREEREFDGKFKHKKLKAWIIRRTKWKKKREYESISGM